MSIIFRFLCYRTNLLLLAPLLLNIWGHAQINSEEDLIKIMDSIYHSNVEDVDEAYNMLKKHALEFEKDSIYIELTFQQIEKNGGLLLYSNSKNLLESLLINENYFLRNHPKLLLRCIHDLARSYLLHNGSSKTISEISEHYYSRYFNLIKTLQLNDDEKSTAQKNKLKYLVHTKNDSLFHYLNEYQVNESNRATYLNHWYRELRNPVKELEYALMTEDKIAIITGHIHNKNFADVDALYPEFLSHYLNEKNALGEHELYYAMGHAYLEQGKFNDAEKFYLKALNYFQNNTSSPYTENIYKDLIDLQSATNNLEKYRTYSSELITHINNLKKQQLEVFRNHLDYSTKISALEIELKNEEEILKIEGFQNQINRQKIIISFALGLIIVSLIFTYFYAISSKTRAELEDANKQMVIDVLRSKFKPHFTFNVLSVINYFVEKQEVKNATLALTKMSSLLRSTLDNMNEKLVSYESEYTICQNYMYLESLRFSHKFDYDFQPLEHSLVKNWLIPPGVIEPILENAVNHAFKGINIKGKISLTHQIIDNSFLKISIKDNGTGFKPYGVLKKKSHGIKITKDYIKTVSNLYKKPIRLEFFSNNGTEVVLTIPKLNPDVLNLENVD